MITPAIRSLLAFSVSVLISKLTGLLLQPLTTRWLGLSNYGLLDVLITFSTFLSLLILFGFVEVIYRFAHESQQHHDHLIATAWYWVLIWGGALFACIVLLREHIQAWLPSQPPIYALLLLSASVWCNALTAVLLAKLKLEDKATTFMKSMILFSGLQAVGVLTLTPSWQLNGLITAGFLAQLGQLLALQSHRPNATRISLKRPLRYALMITVSGIMGFLCLGAERWVIASQLSTAQLAPYAIAMQWALASSLLFEPFSLWWFPRRLKHLSDPHHQQRIANISVLGCLIAVWITATSILILPTFLTYWLPPDFHTSQHILPIFAWAMTLKMASSLLNIGCYQQASGNSVFFIAVILATIYLPMVFIAIYFFGLMGAVISVLLIQVIRLFLFFYWSQRLLPLSYPLTRYGGSLLLLALLTLFQYQKEWPWAWLTWIILNAQILWATRNTLKNRSRKNHYG